jgi:hypothetical protein
MFVIRDGAQASDAQLRIGKSIPPKVVLMDSAGGSRQGRTT